MGELTSHWASELETGDRAKVTIRHINDGSKNLINVLVIIIEQIPCIKSIKVAHGQDIYTLPYNEFSPI